MDGNPHEPHSFPANPAFVYRALPYDNLLNRRGVHKQKIFLRHPVREKNGLSVTTTIASCKAQFDREMFGIRRVNVAALRKYGLELFPTSDTHANIKLANGSEIPIARGQDEKPARDIAAFLMDNSERIDHWNAENADEIEARRVISN